MRPVVAVHTPLRSRWIAALAERLPDVDVAALEEVTDPDAVVAALVWNPPPGSLARCPNLRLIQSFGHGVDHLAHDETLPDVPVARLVDPGLARSMARYVVHAALHHLLDADAFSASQAESEWRPRAPRFIDRYPMAVLGYGVIGAEIARLASEAGFKVVGWSRTPKPGAAHEVLAGSAALSDAVSTAGVVVNVLPLTDATVDLCDDAFFGQLRSEDTLFINVGRGGTVDEDALMRALDGGSLGHAVLDVTKVEPLPSESPLWSHPRVTITPHVSGPTEIGTSADLVAVNLRRAIAGEEPQHLVDLTRGY